MALRDELHGRAIAPIGCYLDDHVETHRLGTTYDAAKGFVIARDNDTVLAPDVAFVSSARLNELRTERGFASGAPDLVVEVVSPGDSANEVQEKVLPWLEVGTRMMIVIRPRSRTVTVYRSHHEIRILSETDVLAGEDVVPGWELPVNQVFEQT